MDVITAKIATAALRRLRKQEAEYEQYCRDMAREGYSPQYCRHGMNLWVDYDPICGYCEQGDSIYRMALDYTHDEVGKLKDKLAAIITVGRLFPNFDMKHLNAEWDKEYERLTR